jgi:hypothetical protein
MKTPKSLSTSLIRRRPGAALWRRGHPTWNLSLPEPPVGISRRRGDVNSDQARSNKLLSFEVELGGLAVEFKAKGLRGALTWLAIDVTALAVLQELTRPRQFRTWHGRVARVVPYDFRKPTLRRVLGALWAPGNPHLFTDTPFGVGWSLNLAQLPRVLLAATRSAPKPASSPYVAPHLPTAQRG